MENTGFYDLSNGSTPATGRRTTGLYDLNVPEPEQEVPRYTGNQKVDMWLSTLPEDQRADAIKKLNEPLTGEEIAGIIDKDPSYRFVNERDFLAYKDFRKNEERSILADLADGMAGMTDIIGTAVSQVAEDPGKSALLVVPSIVEGAFQAARDTFGMISESTNPNSPVFRFRHALFGTGSIADQMRQTNEALAFNERSNRLLTGEETLAIDKDFIHPGVTQVAAVIADPAAIIPFGKAAKLVGITNVAMKGAKALGFGANMVEASIKAQKIKTSLMSGALQWGVGMPLDAIGGVVKGSIDYSVERFGKMVEFTTGVDAADVSRATQLAGAGTATAGLAGVSVPYATTAATAYYAGSFAKGMGEAIGLVSEQMRKQGGHRGLFSYAKNALEETEAQLAKTGGRLNPATVKMLKLIDKIDPIASYSAEAFSGALVGGGVGALLGGLNEGVKGIGFGAGMGVTAGAFGAVAGRGFADVSGATFRQRLMVSSEFARRLYAEKDPTSAMMLDRLMTDSRMDGETRRILDLFSLALGKVDGLVSFRALTDAEYPTYLNRLNELGLWDPSTDPTPNKFKQADGFALRRMKNGAVEVVINRDKFFSRDGNGRFTVAHEFLHGFLMSSSLGDAFRGMFRDAVLGTRDAKGNQITKGIIPTNEFKEFVTNYYSQGISSLLGPEQAVRRNQIRQYLKLVDKWEAQGKKGSEKLNQTELDLLEKMTEEFGAYYFSAWFDGADAYFLASGGKLDGIRSVMDSLKNGWLDMVESRVSMHEPMFPFTRNRGGDLTRAFFRDGSRIRVGAMDYLIRDMYRMSSSLGSTGQIDLTSMGDSTARAFLDRAGLDDVVRRGKNGRWSIKDQNQTAAEARRLGDSAEKILEGLDPSVRTSKKGADGVIRGPFSKPEMDALVDAGVISEGLAGNFLLLQEMANNPQVSNVASFGYLGKERGLSVTDDNLRARGKDVPYTNRDVVVIEAIGEVSKSGKFSWRIRALDLKVIDRRMANVWGDTYVRALFDGDLMQMRYDFYNVYLRNASLPSDHPARMPSAQLWAEKGAQKRDVMHQIAGFAKSDDLSYLNLPIAQIPRGTLSSVTDFSIGRMHVIRQSQTGRLPYVHANAFRDIAANFKFSATVEETTPSGKIHHTSIGYTYHERDGEFTVLDPSGNVVAKTAKAGKAEEAAISNFERRAENITDTIVTSAIADIVGPRFSLSSRPTFTNADELSPALVSLVQGLEPGAYFDLPFDVFISSLRRPFPSARHFKEFLSEKYGFTEAELAYTQGDRRDSAASLDVYVPNIYTISEGGAVPMELAQRRFSPADWKFGKHPVDAMAGIWLSMAMRAGKRSDGMDREMAMLFYHISLAKGLHSEMRFDESKRRFIDGLDLVEPGTYGTPAAGRGKKSLILKEGTSEGLINIDEFSRETPNAIPMVVGVARGRLTVNVQNMQFWKADYLLNTEEGAALMAKTGLTRSEVEAVRYEYMKHGGKIGAFSKGTDRIHQKIWQSPSLKDKDLIDRISRKYTAGAAIEAQKQGYGLMLMPQVNPDKRWNAFSFLAISPNVYSDKSGIPSAPTPQPNAVVVASNAELRNGRYERVERSPLAFYQDVKNSAQRDLKISLSDIDLGNVRFTYSGPNHYSRPFVSGAVDENLSIILHSMAGRSMNASSSSPGIANSHRQQAVSVENATFIDTDHLPEVLRRVSELEAEAARNMPMMSKEEYDASIGGEGARLARIAEEKEVETRVFSRLYHVFSKLDDDFIGLTENGVGFVASVEGGPGFALAGSERLDAALELRNSDYGHPLTERDQNALLAYISTIGNEVEANTNGYIKIEFIERKRLIYDGTIGDPVAHRTPSYAEASQVMLRPTFVWTEKAKSELRQFVAAIGLDPATYAANFSGWRDIIGMLPELRTTLLDPNSPQRQANDRFARSLVEMREGTSKYYRSYLDRSHTSSMERERAASGVKTYDDYVDGYEEQLRYAAAERVSDFIDTLPDDVFWRITTEQSESSLRDALKDARHSTKNQVQSGNFKKAAERQLLAASRTAELIGLLKELDSTSQDPLVPEYVRAAIAHALRKTRSSEFLSFNPEEGLSRASIDAGEAFLRRAEVELAIDKIVDSVGDAEILQSFDQILKSRRLEFKDIAYKDALRPSLSDAVETSLAKFPTGITAQNLIKELEKINSSGAPVLEEARVTGFMDFLKEKAAMPKDPQTGKFPKLDMEEVRQFLKANALELVIGKDVRFDIDAESLVNKWIVKPAGREKLGGGNVIVRATNKRYWPGEGRGSHVQGTPGHGQDTYAWVRYTIRKTSDGRRIMYIEESQAQNNGTVKQALEVQEAVASALVKEMTSAGAEAIVNEIRQGVSKDMTVGDVWARVTDEIVSSGMFSSSDYFDTDFLSVFAKSFRDDYIETPRALYVNNMMARIPLTLVNRLAATSAEHSRMLLNEANGRGIQEFLGSTLTNEVMMTDDVYSKITDGLVLEVPQSRAEVILEDGSTLTVNEHVSVGQVPSLATFTVASKSPRLARFIEFLANEAFEPGTIEGIIDMYNGEVVRRQKAYADRGHSGAMSHWADALNEIFKEADFKEKVADYVKGRVLAKSYTDTDAQGRPVTVRFKSVSSLVASYRDFLGRMVKDSSLGGTKGLYKGNFFPEFVRESAKIHMAHARDLALVKITSDALASKSMREFLRRDYNMIYSDVNNPFRFIMHDDVGGAIVRLMRFSNGIDSDTVYSRALSRVRDFYDRVADSATSNRDDENLRSMPGFVIAEGASGNLRPSIVSRPYTHSVGHSIRDVMYMSMDWARPADVYSAMMGRRMLRESPELAEFLKANDSGVMPARPLLMNEGALMVAPIDPPATPRYQNGTFGLRSPDIRIDYASIVKGIISSETNRRAILSAAKAKMVGRSSQGADVAEFKEAVSIAMKMAPESFRRYIDAGKQVFYRDSPFGNRTMDDTLSTRDNGTKAAFISFKRNLMTSTTKDAVERLMKYLHPEEERERLKSLMSVPFLESKEYFTLLGKAALMVAIRDGLDGIAVLAPADGASNSNLSYGKGLEIYGNFIPNYYLKAFKKLGLEGKPSNMLRYKTWMDPESENAAFAAIEFQHKRRLKALAKVVTMKSTKKHGNNYALKPEYLLAIARMNDAIRILGERNENNSPFINGVDGGDVKSLRDDFIERIAMYEGQTSASKHLNLARDSDGTSKISSVNKDPVGDAFAASAIWQVTNLARLTKGTHNSIKKNARHAAAMTTQVPFLKMLLSQETAQQFVIKKDADGNIDFLPTSLNVDNDAFVGTAQALGELRDTVSYLGERGLISGDTYEKIGDILEIIEAAGMEIAEHNRTFSHMKLKDFDAQLKVSEDIMPPRPDGTAMQSEEFRNVWARAGKPSNRTDLYMRGFVVDIDKAKPEVVDKIRKEGTYMLKPTADGDEGGSMVGPGTKAFTGGFISTVASAMSDISRRVRIYAGIQGNTDGAVMNVRLYPRGNEQLGADNRYVEVKAVLSPTNRSAALIVSSPDQTGKYVHLAKAEIDARLRGMGYSMIHDDGFRAYEHPRAGSVRETAFSYSSFQSTYANSTKQGREVVDRLNRHGAKLVFGRTGSRQEVDSFDGSPSALIIDRYKIAISNGSNTSDMSVQVDVFRSGLDGLKAKVVGSSYNAPKFDYMYEGETGMEMLSPEERKLYQYDRTLDNSELKQVMLAELMDRLAIMGVTEVEGLEKFVRRDLDSALPGEPTEPDLAAGMEVFRDNSMMAYEDAAEILRPENIRTSIPKGSSKPAMSASIPKGTSYKPTASRSWIPGREGAVYTLTSTDGYIISFKNRKYRLFSPQRAMLGVYDDEEQAKKKADSHARKAGQ